MTKGRFDFVDVAKGIGIILVIFAHLLPDTNKLTAIIYSFHMPMFFYLSGLFAGKSIAKFGTFLKKQIKRLLIPFLLVFLIGWAVTTLVPIFESQTMKEVLNEFVYANPIGINVGPIWFLVAMFNTAILFYFYHKFILSKKDTFLTAFSLAAIAILAFYVTYAEDRIGISLPFKIDVSLMSLVFYSLGFISKETIFEYAPKKNKAIWSLLLCAFEIVAVTILLNGMTYLSVGIYGVDLFVYIFTALCGTMFVITISKYLSKNKLLKYIGQNSLVIFSVHSIFVAVINHFIDLKSFNAYIMLLFAIVGTIVVLVIMIGISKILNFAKMKIANSRK